MFQRSGKLRNSIISELFRGFRCCVNDKSYVDSAATYSWLEYESNRKTSVILLVMRT